MSAERAVIFFADCLVSAAAALLFDKRFEKSRSTKEGEDRRFEAHGAEMFAWRDEVPSPTGWLFEPLGKICLISLLTAMRRKSDGCIWPTSAFNAIAAAELNLLEKKMTFPNHYCSCWPCSSDRCNPISGPLVSLSKTSLQP
ncbi:unnamed protein product, partial [Phaeothamnion confervicola]